MNEIGERIMTTHYGVLRTLMLHSRCVVAGAYNLHLLLSRR